MTVRHVAQAFRPANAALKRCATFSRSRLFLVGALALVIWRLKRYYADAAVDDLRWILDPTTRLVAAMTGARFEWEPGEGYLSRERLFLIEKVCAGINFMMAAFGMVAWTLGRRVATWRSGVSVFAVSVLAAYSAAVLVNAGRITFAMWMATQPEPMPGMTAAQAHRVEGIAFYFGGLVLLYELVRRFDSPANLAVTMTTPLIWYYAVTVAIPLANGAAGREPVFVEHSLFVVVIPLLVIALSASASAIMYAVSSRTRTCMQPEPPHSASQPHSAPRAAQLSWPRLRPHNLRR